MSNKNIFRYLAGKLPGKAANRLEREAADDAFLYEALEGLEQQEGLHADNVKALRRKLSRRLKPATVRRNYYLQEAAIIIIFLTVGGLLMPKLYERNAPHRYADWTNDAFEEEVIFTPVEAAPQFSDAPQALPVAPYIETAVVIDDEVMLSGDRVFNVQLEPVDPNDYVVQHLPEKDSLVEEVIPYVAVEQPPKFMMAGVDVGEKGFSRWVIQHLKYPAAAIEQDLRGRVVCSFVITAEGKVTDVKVVDGVHPLLDKEALRVISSSPDWLPGKQYGRPVAVLYRIPVVFVMA